MFQVFADDPFQCAVLAHLREGIVQLVVQPAAVIFGKGNAQPGDQQRLFEDAECRVVVFHVLQDGRLVGGDGVHIAAGQHGILHTAVFDAEHLDGLRDARVGAAEEDALWLGGALHHHGLPGKVAEGLDTAVSVHGHDLTAHHVRSGPPVERFAALHGKAAPDAVDGAAFHKGGLLFPVDDFKSCSVSHAAECLGGDLHIDPGRGAVIVQINIGRVGVASDEDLRQIAVLRVRSAAGGQAAEGRRGRQQGASVQECTA